MDIGRSTLLVLAVIAGLIAFAAVIAGLGYIPDLLERVRGKPKRIWTKAEQLHIDLLRARGHTRRSAMRWVESMARIKNGEDILSSPLRDSEAQAIANKLQADFAAGRLPPELAQAYSESLTTVLNAKGPR